jgi:hypothetical protein
MIVLDVFLKRAGSQSKYCDALDAIRVRPLEVCKHLMNLFLSQGEQDPTRSLRRARM